MENQILNPAPTLSEAVAQLKQKEMASVLLLRGVKGQKNEIAIDRTSSESAKCRERGKECDAEKAGPKSEHPRDAGVSPTKFKATLPALDLAVLAKKPMALAENSDQNTTVVLKSVKQFPDGCAKCIVVSETIPTAAVKRGRTNTADPAHEKANTFVKKRRATPEYEQENAATLIKTNTTTAINKNDGKAENEVFPVDNHAGTEKAKPTRSSSRTN